MTKGDMGKKFVKICMMSFIMGPINSLYFYKYHSISQLIKLKKIYQIFNNDLKVLLNLIFWEYLMNSWTALAVPGVVVGIH